MSSVHNEAAPYVQLAANIKDLELYLGYSIDKYKHNVLKDEQSVRVLERYVHDCLVQDANSTCMNIKLAAVRHLIDLQREQDDTFPYRFSTKHAERAISFYQHLRHVKVINSQFKLLPWQQFIIGSIFGWVRKTKDPSTSRYNRRYKYANIFVARKNGKSTLACGIALYMLLMDGEPGAEVYTCAPTGAQAQIVFNDAKRMLQNSAFGSLPLIINDKVIKVPFSNSTFIPLNAKAGNNDGRNSHCCVLDEIHSFKKPDMYDVMRTSIGARSNPLFLVISTAGTELGCIGHEVFQTSESILRGDVPQADFEDTFAALYTIDKGDDFTDPIVWRKANPSLGSARKDDDLISLSNEALHRPSSRANFFTKYLNVFVQGSDQWLSEDDIQNNLNIDLKLQDYVGTKTPCYIGVDLSENQDLTAISYVFVHKDKEGERISMFTKAFFPAESTSKIPQQQMNKYYKFSRSNDDSFEITNTITTDINAIKDHIREAHKQFNVKSVQIDRWHASQMVQDLQKQKIPAELCSQSRASLNEPTKLLERLILQGKAHHNGSPVLVFCMRNAVLRTDKNGSCSVEKDPHASQAKIDCIKAVITALAGYVHSSEPKTSGLSVHNVRLIGA